MTKEIKFPENTGKLQEKKPRKNMFVKGQSGNPAGKPKGAVNEVTKFKAAIAEFEKEQNKDIYKFILDKASRYPQVLIAIFKALVPQQTEINASVKHEGIYAGLSDQELIDKANEIFNHRATAGFGEPVNRA